MKQFSLTVALVAVTTLFATAFTASHNDQQGTKAATENQVAQVVIIGKRMTALEKNQYDAEMLAQSDKSANKIQSDEFRLAVK